MNDIDSALFKISDIFDISTGANVSEDKLIQGNIPRISATAQNNGIQRYTNLIDDSHFRTSENFISISFLGNSFYHPYLASVDMKIHILKSKDVVLNRYNGTYLTTVLNKQMKKYNYGNQLSSSKLKKEILLLPITNDNEPNYEFMENYMKTIEQNLYNKYKNYVKSTYNNFDSSNYDLNSVEWKEFYIKDIFQTIQRGKRLTKANFINGNTPYISSSATTNGVDSFVGNKEKVRIFENCLTLANSGSVGSTFYHPYQFVASDHVTHLKNDNFDKYIYLFIASVIKRLEDKYNFNREINDKRLKNEIIMLPITETGEINYQFMEDYIKHQEAKLIKKYLDYLTAK